MFVVWFRSEPQSASGSQHIAFRPITASRSVADALEPFRLSGAWQLTGDPALVTGLSGLDILPDGRLIAVGDRGSIRVDINQAWSPHEARVGLAALEYAGVVLAEQPVQAGMIDAMADLTRTTRLAVMADEALSGPESALRFAASGARGSLVMVIW